MSLLSSKNMKLGLAAESLAYEHAAQPSDGAGGKGVRLIVKPLVERARRLAKVATGTN